MTIHPRYIFLLTTFCFASIIACGQEGISSSESLVNLSNSLIKKEIAGFAIKGKTLAQENNSIKPNLHEIPLRNCSDNEVHLSLSTFTSSVSTFIHLYFKTGAAAKSLDSIFLVTHSHFWVRIPDSAYKGLLQTGTCNFKRSGKNDEFHSPNYKAFYSADKKRLYIYMLGETSTNKYEVTWVIVNDKYVTRIFDWLPS
ncbi:MAG: hypothetical protein QM726_11190 [Chitinophagaceae bacterium]